MASITYTMTYRQTKRYEASCLETSTRDHLVVEALFLCHEVVEHVFGDGEIGAFFKGVHQVFNLVEIPKD